MENIKILFHSLKVCVIIALLLCTSCAKEKKFEPGTLLGTWNGLDSGYKLEFNTDSDFWKNGDHYNYWITKDSITIQYSGVLFIYVEPTTHSYLIKDDILTIDFKSGCYGFDSKVEKFKKE